MILRKDKKQTDLTMNKIPKNSPSCLG
jgi:hypothetical protein